MYVSQLKFSSLDFGMNFAKFSPTLSFKLSLAIFMKCIKIMKICFKMKQTLDFNVPGNLQPILTCFQKHYQEKTTISLALIYWNDPNRFSKLELVQYILNQNPIRRLTLSCLTTFQNIKLVIYMQQLHRHVKEDISKSNELKKHLLSHVSF